MPLGSHPLSLWTLGLMELASHLIRVMAAHRSVVKIKNTGCTGSTTNAVTPWATGTTSPDNCAVYYTTLDDNKVTISAMAIDGEDNLWVCPAKLPSQLTASL